MCYWILVPIAIHTNNNDHCDGIALCFNLSLVTVRFFSLRLVFVFRFPSSEPFAGYRLFISLVATVIAIVNNTFFLFFNGMADGWVMRTFSVSSLFIALFFFIATVSLTSPRFPRKK